MFKFLIILNLFLSYAFAQDKQYVDLGAKIIDIDNTKLLSVQFRNTKKWHTYWKNPGDAGLEIKFKFFLNGEMIKLKPYPWPAPKRYIEQGNMWAYGYADDYAMFFDTTDTLKNKTLKIVGEWLVCKDICIPGTRTIEFKVNSELNGEFNSFIADSKLIENFKTLPYVHNNYQKIKFFLNKAEGDSLNLFYMIENASADQIKEKTNIVTPYHAFPFDYKHEEVFIDAKNKIIYGRFAIDWDGVYEEPVWNLPTDGEFKNPVKANFLLQYPKDERAKIIETEFSQFSLNEQSALTKILSTLKPLDLDAKSSKTSLNDTPTGFWTFILFAFLGGLILNLMPCVLPVISLKLFGLILHSDESKKSILKHNLFYTLGVVTTFIVLAMVVHFLKANGEIIGWGFQLQSPGFVFLMMSVIFLMALNMLGLFEFITPGGRSFGNKELKKGFTGDFTSGVLATILSTPCSAPFLGTALPFAFSTTSLNLYLIFISIGLGLAFPFILTGIFPVTVKFLPRPGAWMDKLKKFLGLTLLLTVIWLYDVLFSIVDNSTSGIYVNTFLVLVFFAFYFRANISKKLFPNIIAFSLPLLMLPHLFNNFQVVPMDSMAKAKSSTGSLVFANWSPQMMDEIRKNHDNTFIYFTAKWCITCKVNEKLIIASDDFKELVKNNKMGLLVGDWTQRDDRITEFLAEHNLAGVPAYFILKKDGTLISLGETLSVDKVKKHL